MLKRIDIDRSNPVWAQVWGHNALDPKTRVYLFTANKTHYCVSYNTTEAYLNGGEYDTTEWLNIRFPKPLAIDEVVGVKDGSDIEPFSVTIHTKWLSPGELLLIKQAIDHVGLEIARRRGTKTNFYWSKDEAGNDRP